MAGSFGRSMAWAELRGRDRGLRGASSVWLAVWVVATAYRYAKRFTDTEPVVVREKLKPGQQLVITHYAKGAEPADARRLTRRQRRKARRTPSDGAS